jgi:hypothetical protein
MNNTVVAVFIKNRKLLMDETTVVTLSITNIDVGKFVQRANLKIFKTLSFHLSKLSSDMGRIS